MRNARMLGNISKRLILYFINMFDVEAVSSRSRKDLFYDTKKAENKRHTCQADNKLTFLFPLRAHLTAAKESSELIKWKQKHQRVKIYEKISSRRQRRKSWLLCVSPLNCQEINKNIEITPMARARPRQWHWYLRRNLPHYLVQLHRLNNSSHELNESRKVAKRSLAH